MSLPPGVIIKGVKGFTFEELSRATDNFRPTCELGQGGYGKVYKGILEDGSAVAIKRAQEGSMQGAVQFYTEIELLSRVHHRNLVSLVGYCNDRGEQVRPLPFCNFDFSFSLEVQRHKPNVRNMSTRLAFLR